MAAETLLNVAFLHDFGDSRADVTKTAAMCSVFRCGPIPQNYHTRWLEIKPATGYKVVLTKKHEVETNPVNYSTSVCDGRYI